MVRGVDLHDPVVVRVDHVVAVQHSHHADDASATASSTRMSLRTSAGSARSARRRVVASEAQLPMDESGAGGGRHGEAMISTTAAVRGHGIDALDRRCRSQNTSTKSPPLLPPPPPSLGG